MRARYAAIDSFQANTFATLLEQQACARNLKETIELTAQWLSDVEHKHILNNTANSNESELFERLRGDVAARRDALLKAQSKLEVGGGQSRTKATATSSDQLLTKLEAVSRKLEQKVGRHKQLQSMLDQFSTGYERLCMQWNRVANRLEVVDAAAILTTTSPLSLVQSQLKQCEDIERELTESVDLKVALDTCVAQIENLPFLEEVFTRPKLDTILKDVADLALDMDNLKTLTSSRLVDLAQTRDQLASLGENKAEFERWLHATETSLAAMQPVSILAPANFETQLAELGRLVAEHTAKLVELDSLSSSSQRHLAKHQPIQIRPISTCLVQLRRKSVSRSTENLSVRLLEQECGSGDSAELRKLAELYQWLGERMHTRRADLQQALGQSRPLTAELENCKKNLVLFESSMCSLFSGVNSIDELKSVRLTTTAVELPSLSELADELVELKYKSKHLLFDSNALSSVITVNELRSELNALNDRHAQIQSVYSDLRQRLEKFALSVNFYSKLHSELSASLTRKTEQVAAEKKSVHLTTQLAVADAELKRLDAIRGDLLKSDAKQLDALNKHGDQLAAESELIQSELASINSRFACAVDDLRTIYEHKQNARDKACALASADAKLKLECAECTAKCEECAKTVSTLLTSTSVSQLTSSVKRLASELNQLEAENLAECTRAHDLLSRLAHDLFDLTQSYLLLNLGDNASSNDASELDTIVHEAKQRYQNTVQLYQASKQSVERFFNKQQPFLVAYATLREFINRKSSQLDHEAHKMSAAVDVLAAQQREHEKLVHELTERDPEVKRLVQMYAEYYQQEEQKEQDEFGARMGQLCAEIESGWSVLCGRGDVRKEKLFVGHTLAHEFERVHSCLISRLSHMEANANNSTNSSGNDHQAADLEGN